MSQTDFIASVLDSNKPFANNLKTWNGSDPEYRFNVYRNNVVVSLIEAIRKTFVVTEKLVGENFFTAMAGVFVREYPPRSTILAYYGDQFSSFIKNFPPVKNLPYLADVAQLEYLQVLAYHAQDNAPIQHLKFHHLLQQTSADRLIITLDASVQLFTSKYAIYSIWATHQQSEPISNIDLTKTEHCIIFRDNWNVGVQLIPEWLWLFLSQLQQRKTLGEAVNIITDNNADLTAAFTFLLENNLIVGVSEHV